MNALFFLLVAILGSLADGVKVRAIRRRLVEYPYEPPRQHAPVPPQIKHTQSVTMKEDPRLFTYADKNAIPYNIYGPDTYGGKVNQNRRVMVNVPHVFWANPAGRDLFQFSEGRSGQNEYNLDQISQDGAKERISYHLDQTDSNSDFKEISLNPIEQSSKNDEQTVTLSQNELNSSNSNRTQGSIEQSESNETGSGEIEITTSEDLADKLSENHIENNVPVSLASILSAPANEEAVDTIDHSKASVENVNKIPIRYVDNKYFLFPPLSRQLYPVDDTKTDWENETSHINMDYVTNIKEDNSGLIRLVPERDFISVDDDGKYSGDQSVSNRASLKNVVNVFDVINNGENAQIRLRSGNDFISPGNKNIYMVDLNKFNLNTIKPDKAGNSNSIYLVGENELNLDNEATSKGVVQVINVPNEKNLAPINFVANDDATSTDVEKKYSADQNKIEKEDHLPFYVYRFGQNTYLYQPTDQNITWKQVGISNQPQMQQAEQSAEKISNICLKCEVLLKILSQHPNIIAQYGLYGLIGDTSDHENKIKVPTDSTSWNYIKIKGEKEPTSNLQYYQPAVITKTVNDNNEPLNIENKYVNIFGYNKLKYPQILSTSELTDDKLNLVAPTPQSNLVVPKPQLEIIVPKPKLDLAVSKTQRNPQYGLLTLVVDKPNVQFDETRLGASKPNGETLQIQPVPDAKKDSATESLSKTPDSSIIYISPILKQPNKVTLPASAELRSQNIPIKSHNLPLSNVPERLLILKTSYASEVSTTPIPGSEEHLAVTDDVTNFPKIHNDIIETDYFPSSEAPNDFDTSTTDAPGTRRTAIRKESLTSKAPHKYTKPYVLLATDSEYKNNIPKELVHTKTSDGKKPHMTPEKTPNANYVSTTNAPLATDSFTTPHQLLLDVTETPTTNTIPEETTHVSSATYSNEEIPTDSIDKSTTDSPLVTEKNSFIVTKELLPSKGQDASNVSTTNSPSSTNWYATPEKKQYSEKPDVTKKSETTTTPGEFVPSETPGTSKLPESSPTKTYHWTNIPKHLLPSKESDSIETPTELPQKTSNDFKIPVGIIDDWSKHEQSSTSQQPNTTPVSITIEEEEESEPPAELGVFKRPTGGLNKSEEILFSEELDKAKVPTATSSPTDWIRVTGESLPSLESNVFKLPTSETANDMKPEDLQIRIKIANDEPKGFLISEILDKPKVPAGHNSVPTAWIGIRGESIPSIGSKKLKIPTIKPSNNGRKPGKLLISEEIDTSKAPTGHTLIPSDWIGITGESLPSIKSNVFKPINEPLNAGNKPEELLTSEEVRTSKAPTVHISNPTGWIGITGESKPSVKPGSPDYGNQPEQLFISEDPDTLKIPGAPSSTLTGWTSVINELGPSKTPLTTQYDWDDIPERWQSYIQRSNAEHRQLMLLNFEGTTPEERNYIIKVINVLIPDLLRLHNRKCYEDVDEELLNRLKVVINSVLEKDCETSQEFTPLSPLNTRRVGPA